MADPSETTQVSREPAREETEELLGAVRSLAVQVGGLQAELHTLRQEARALPGEGGEQSGWDEGRPAVRESPSWVRSVDSPGARRLAIPWLLLEILFLIAVAVLCAVADLDTPAIAGVMIAAWALVAVAEWATSRASVRNRAVAYTTVPEPVATDDRSWFAGSIEETALDAPDAQGLATRLPPLEAE